MYRIQDDDPHPETQVMPQEVTPENLVITVDDKLVGGVMRMHLEHVDEKLVGTVEHGLGSSSGRVRLFSTRAVNIEPAQLAKLRELQKRLVGDYEECPDGSRSQDEAQDFIQILGQVYEILGIPWDAPQREDLVP